MYYWSNLVKYYTFGDLVISPYHCENQWISLSQATYQSLLDMFFLPGMSTSSTAATSVAWDCIPCDESDLHNLMCVLVLTIYHIISVYLYSTFRTELWHQFSNVASQLFFHQATLHTVSFLIIEGEPPHPRSTPWGAYRPAISHEAVPLYHLACWSWHSLTHSHLADRSMVVGHVLMDYTCSFMSTSHIDMTAHNPAFFTGWVALCELLYAHKLCRAVCIYET